ncbi:ligase-associated DNA damage response exonuclease [Algisphaera agarilytica]|uniref:Putative mRNA 3-end processing factor n=1 Tax=Algisphaera agarilytica TaxID=1385975 RepID=A0A7X0LM37_9BACT|nr:ligase-associated DNA damage response exonuclease [Algisphaera agarilytica]MBB6431657.1 putative mRNA 3-end processing factor [Algisphaera agarilytica]
MGDRDDRLIRPTERGLYCEQGGFYVDPWRPVDRAVVTHAHSDHATPGSQRYLCSEVGVEVLRPRVHNGAKIEGIAYGQTTCINGVEVSLHPAGHLLGSAQVRVEHAGRVEVVTGDYKTQPDKTCDPFEPIRCHRLITECTFGLPIYKWRPEAEIAEQINAWWLANQAAGRTSVVFAYALGKAQRVLSLVDRCLGHIVVHGSVKRFCEVYGAAGVDVPGVTTSTAESRKAVKGKGLVVAPPSVLGTAWLKKFSPASLAFASGWMAVRGNRRRRGVDRGFVLSDHVDWTGLLETIKATGCESVGATHGYTAVVARYLQEQGVEADEISTRYVGELDTDTETSTEPSTESSDSA